MNIAAILAGGSGQRMHLDIPKQFINVNDKPVIIHTLDVFQQHPDIDSILVICIDGWQEILKAYAKQFGITKLKWVVSGGQNGQESAYKGLIELEKFCNADDLIIMHDANRPLVTQEIISDGIIKCRKYGSAIAAIPCTEPIFVKNNVESNISNKSISRDLLVRTQTPHVFSLGKMLWAHREALKNGITNSVAIGTIMIELGETVCLSIGSEMNFKITRMEDLNLFKALINIVRR